MAWTAMKTWVDGEIITASGTGSLNEQIRDNMNALAVHAHTGSAGDGSNTLTNVNLTNIQSFGFADQSANPSATGELQRNGSNLIYYDGTVAIDITDSDASAGTASLRTLGTGATQASAGNHQHEVSPTTVNKNTGTQLIGGGTLGSSFASSGLPINQTGYTVPASGTQYSLTTYSWTPSTAENCFILAKFNSSGHLTNYAGSSSPPPNSTIGDWDMTVQFLVDSVVQQTTTGVSCRMSEGPIQTYLYKTSNTTAKSLEWRFSITAGSLPSNVTDTDASGVATSNTFWGNTIFNQYTSVSYDEITMTV